MADWCTIDLVEPDGTLQRLEVGHLEAPGPGHGSWQRMALEPDAPPCIAKVLLTGQSEFVPVVSPAAASPAADAYERLRAQGVRSFLAVPLAARGQTLGAIRFGITGSERRYEPADLHLAQELGRRAALAVDNARLYHEARQALVARDRVLAFVSHDLRNPLSTIRLGAGMLKMPRLPDEWRVEQIELIQRSAEQMGRLIEDLLDVAKMEAGRMAVEPGAAPPEALVSEALRLHGAQAQERNVKLDSRLDAELPPVRADRGRLLQVFANLLGNALKFTPPEGRICVQATSAGDEVVFCVADTGPGIPPAEQPRLFDPFWQGRVRGRGSAGLGLAITKGIVEAHGGQIWVQSVPGEGSSFYFTLPAHHAEPGRKAAPPA
jgi:signal transduction histidine kinase